MYAVVQRVAEYVVKLDSTKKNAQLAYATERIPDVE